MILEHLDTTKIKTTEWFMIELRSERTSEETIRRIGKELSVIFPNEPAEVFVPLKERDCATFTLLTDCYLFVRADDPVRVGKIRRVTGVLGILAQDESTRPSKFLKVPDEYVQGLIATCWEQHQRQSAGVTVGSWVRLIDGQMRDFCGYVLGILNGRATVRIAARTKLIVVETSVHNLKDLSDVPEGARVFYYSEPVTRFLEEHGDTASEALAPDRAFNREEMASYLCQHSTEGHSATHGRRSTRQPLPRERTPTRFLESLLEGGERDVPTLLAKIAEAIRNKHIRPPSTATVLWHIIRETIRRTVFGDDPTIKTYSDVVARHGSSWVLTPKQVLEALPELPLRPAHSVQVHEELIPATHRPTVTVTTLVREELSSGRRNMWVVVKEAERALKAGSLKAPKHLDSLVQAIRTQVLRHFREECPSGGIKALVDIYGEGLHVTSVTARAKFPRLEALVTSRRAEQLQPMVVTTRSVEDVVPPRAPKPTSPSRVTTSVEAVGIIPKRNRRPPVKTSIAQ